MTAGAAFEIVKLVRAIAEDADRSLEQMHADGVVVTREGLYASVRIGANDAPTPGFYVPPALDVQEGDHVLVFRPRGYALILAVLNRNANAFGPDQALLPHGHSGATDGGSIITPAALNLGTAAVTVALDQNEDDWSPEGLDAVSVIRVSPSGAFEVSGIAAQSGRLLILINASAVDAIKLLNDDSGSTISNRIYTANGRPFFIRQRQAVALIRDVDAARWVVLGSEQPQMERKRTAVGTINAASSQASVAVTWTTPFPDTNYTVVLTMLSNDLTGGGAGALTAHVRTKSTTGLLVRCSNGSSTTAVNDAVLEAIAVAD